VYKIKVGEGRVIESSPKLTLLESLEQHDIEVHYHCRDGYCGACAVTLKSGEVNYKLEPLAFIRDGYVLTCCAQACSNIELDVEH
jgi:ferredoxin